jgi:hypothetical protein
MPEPKITRVYFEGDDDSAFLDKLRAAGIWPSGWELAQRDKNQHPGKEGLIRQLLPFINPKGGVGGHAAVLIDLDGFPSEAELASWFKKEMEKELGNDASELQFQAGPADGRVRSFRLDLGDRVGRVALIAVGCPNDDELKTIYQISRFAIDDWVFRLALNETVFEAVNDFKAVKYATAKQKYLEVAELFRKNELEVRKSKTYLQILRAMAAIGPSTATIVGRITQKAITALGEPKFREFLQPFLEDLNAAARLLQ